MEGLEEKGRGKKERRREKKEKERERRKEEKRRNYITNSLLENDFQNFISHNDLEMC